jgi:hypothetical protein
MTELTHWVGTVMQEASSPFTPLAQNKKALAQNDAFNVNYYKLFDVTSYKFGSLVAISLLIKIGRENS